MLIEEVLDSAGRHCEDGKGFGTVELYVFDGGWRGKLGVWGGDQGVEVLKELLDRDLEGQVVADYLCWVVLCVGVLDFLLGS